ncbi:MAG: hypothetical protein HY674_11385 [Chloroflexi bacterium]|nr:hypothetical protein [Chloroflexota bacterium]
MQDHLLQAWESAEAWLAGYYLIMPDHLHFFSAPRDLKFTIEQWITFWKRQFRRIHQDPACRFQADAFHYRLRRDENYIEKWNYVRENPLRKGLVQHPEDWPYQGMLNVLQW